MATSDCFLGPFSWKTFFQLFYSEMFPCVPGAFSLPGKQAEVWDGGWIREYGVQLSTFGWALRGVGWQWLCRCKLTFCSWCKHTSGKPGRIVGKEMELRVWGAVCHCWVCFQRNWQAGAGVWALPGVSGAGRPLMKNVEWWGEKQDTGVRGTVYHCWGCLQGSCRQVLITGRHLPVFPDAGRTQGRQTVRAVLQDVGHKGWGAIDCCWVYFQGSWWAREGDEEEYLLMFFGASWPSGKQAELWGSNYLNVNDLSLSTHRLESVERRIDAIYSLLSKIHANILRFV